MFLGPSQIALIAGELIFLPDPHRQLSNHSCAPHRREPTARRELADRENVLPRTIRTYRDRIEALDLVRVDERGSRLARSFQTATEHRDAVVPTFLENGQLLLDAADTLLLPERYGDPKDPLGSVLFWPPDTLQLLGYPTVGPWLRVAAVLTATRCFNDDRTVRVGLLVKQTSFFSTHRCS